MDVHTLDLDQRLDQKGSAHMVRRVLPPPNDLVCNGKREPSSVRKNPLLNYYIHHKSQPYVNNFQGKIISKKCKY